MRAVIYTRASLDRTGEGKSNARQREECIRLVEFKRWTLVEVDGEPSLDDVSISAYGDKERPAWNRVLAMIEAGEVDVVVAWHLDRLTRNMADLEKLILLCEENDVSVATATGDIDLTNDTGRMVARILAAVARQEVERKAARQRLAHMQRRAEGRPWAAVKMLGYSPAGEVIEREAAAIRQAMQDVIDQRASLSELGRRWTELELRSPYQQIKDDEGAVVGWKPWTPRGVKKVLTNPRIAGFITVTPKTGAPEVLGRGSWTPIVDESTLTLVTARLNDPERVNGKVKKGRKASNLLTGIMVCAKCGGTVRAGSNRGVLSYTCGKWCAQVEREGADELVRSAFAATVGLVMPGSVVPAGEKKVDPEGVGDEIARLKERQALLARSFARGITPESAYEPAVEEITNKIRELETLVSGSAEAAEWERLRAESARDFLGQGTMEQRRVLARSAVITLHPGVRGQSGPRRQIEMMVKAERAGREVLVPAHVPE